MAGIDWEAAANHWTSQEASEKRLPEPELMTEIESFIGRHKVCALACAGGGIVRNTPVEYLYAEGSFWIFSEGGLKFKALAACKDVCLAIFDDDPSFGSLGGLQITGTATVLEPFGPAYEHACDLRKLPIDQLRKLPFAMNVIQVTPTRFDFLDSELKARGYSTRQHIDFAR